MYRLAALCMLIGIVLYRKRAKAIHVPRVPYEAL